MPPPFQQRGENLFFPPGLDTLTFLWYIIGGSSPLYVTNSKLSRACKLTRKDSRTILSSLALYLSQTFLIVTMLIVGGMGSVTSSFDGGYTSAPVFTARQHRSVFSEKGM